jgi:hypothetical protein
MRWLMDRLAPPPDMPPPRAGLAAADALRDHVDRLYGRAVDRRIGAAHAELDHQRARLAALDVRAAVRARQVSRE